MGTISDKLTYLNTTKSQLKTMISYGYPLTNETFRQYVDSVFKALINSMTTCENPTWNNLPKLTTTPGTTQSINNTTEAPMKIELGANELSQDATPTPDNPIPVNVVSGDNTIEVVGKNLFNGTGWRLVQSGNGFPIPATGATIVSSDENNISFTSTEWAYAGVESGFIKVKANETYMLSGKFTTPTNRFFITQYDENKTRIRTLNSTNVSTLQNTAFTTTNDGYIAIAFTNTTTAQTTYKIEDIQVEKGSTATDYEPYVSQTYSVDLGSIELCKIGDYKDEFIKTTGKNLLDLNGASSSVNGITYTITNNGVKLNGTASADTYIRLGTYKGSILDTFNGKKLTITEEKTGLMFYVDYVENNVWKASQNASVSGTTLSTNYPEMRVMIKVNNGTALNNYYVYYMISNNGGSYEPYGKNEWWLKKAIGKSVLNGTENNWSSSSPATGIYRFYRGFYNEGIYTYTDTNRHIDKFICDHFGLSTNNEINKAFQYQNQLFFMMPSNEYSSVSDWTNWLSNNNIVVYYVLATPTYTKINIVDLIYQLEAIRNSKSQNNQTNINQENTDLAFILNTTAIDKQNLL